MERRVLIGWAAVWVTGCGGAAPALAPPRASPEATAIARPAPVVVPAPAAPPERASACARRRPGTGPVRVGDLRQGGAVALAQLGAATLAYAADEDDDAIHTFDVGAASERAVTPLPGPPAQLLVLADGRVAVTLRRDNRLLLLEPGERAEAPLSVLCEVATPAEPWGLAATPDGTRIVLTSAWGHALSVLDAATLGTLARVDLPREPRSVLVDDDGRRAFVTHLVGGRLSVVDLSRPGEPVHDVSLIPEDREVRDPVRARGNGRPSGDHPTTQGYAIARVPVQAGAPARVLMPVASVDPGPPVASLSYGGSPDSRTVTPLVAVIDPVAERVLPRTRRVDFTTHRRECLLPRAAAATAGGLLVACQGIDALIDLDARSLDPVGVERRRFPVPAGPTGVAVDAENGRAVVWSQFARELSVVSLAAPRGEHEDPASAVQRVPAARKATSRLSAKEQRGRRLFFTSDDPRISHDGRACASCHPDGRDDSLTWSTPDGPRQTIMLAGRVAGSEPYGWFGKNRSLRDHVAQSFARLGGTGLLGAADREDLDALLAWLTAMPAPSVAGAVRDPAHVALALRGRDVFLDPAQGCSNCHLGGGTDKAAHDVQSGDVIESSLAFDTPSLRFVGGTAPYFHDGRYATLEALLERSDGKMGHTLGLPRPDLLALVAYLEDSVMRSSLALAAAVALVGSALPAHAEPTLPAGWIAGGPAAPMTPPPPPAPLSRAALQLNGSPVRPALAAVPLSLAEMDTVELRPAPTWTQIEASNADPVGDAPVDFFVAPGCARVSVSGHAVGQVTLGLTEPIGPQSDGGVPYAHGARSRRSAPVHAPRLGDARPAARRYAPLHRDDRALPRADLQGDRRPSLLGGGEAHPRRARLRVPHALPGLRAGGARRAPRHRRQWGLGKRRVRAPRGPARGRLQRGLPEPAGGEPAPDLRRGHGAGAPGGGGQGDDCGVRGHPDARGERARDDRLHVRREAPGVGVLSRG